MSPYELLARAPLSPELRSLVTMRLEQGEIDYGESYKEWRDGQVMIEIREELADVVAYATLEMARIGCPRRVSFDEQLRLEQLVDGAADLFNLTTGDTE